jgi:hypothetical protein
MADATTPRATPDRWKELAQQLQQESDPQKIIDLAQQLVDEFDRTRSKPAPARIQRMAS